MRISRRGFLAGSAGGALATVAPGLRVALAAGAASGNILVVCFMRGGQDGLQLVAPADDPDYISNRPTIRVQSSGSNAGLPAGSLGGTAFYFHPDLPELKAHYDAKRLAVVEAAGVLTENRSHFVVQDLMERGIADHEPNQSTGWLARHIADLGGGRAALADVADGATAPVSFLGDATAIAVPDAATFNVTGGDAQAAAIRAVNVGNSPYEAGVRTTLDAIAGVQAGLQKVPASTAPYTNGDFSKPLASLAKLIKMDIGVSVATVDMGGWDHHHALNNLFRGRAIELSKSLDAFWQDIAAYQDRVTIVTMTEFGRRLAENASQGLDHGSASTMLVMGAGVNGGKIYGTWPGLTPAALNGGDLAVTTDNRQVLAEIIAKRHGEPTLAQVFPTVGYKPLGILAG
jgi:uncharacterized protein (DUF1501 family)